ncbi:uncharacterized protein KD926_008528 [Aspergillus affinis]|uniref:uncharacterized protein n=1 Tax=Aspergillus affinis TaxID=1070780 RepID=UPI0022FE46B7|nr:uncharacterized protein KD926_008528 [Aspergillus affinis]KAI9040204.1 hypothetical protein KD926_008528 [Aspergillus affinis]
MLVAPGLITASPGLLAMSRAMRTSTPLPRIRTGVIISRRQEIGEYFKSVAADFDLYNRMQFNAQVTSAIWDKTQGTWSLDVFDSTNGTHYTVKGDIFVNAGGILNAWKWPEIPGLDTFQGPCLHTDSWDPSVDLEGKRIGVIGTGATGVQVVPQLQKVGRSVTLFMRTPSYILPNVGFGIEASTFNEECDEARKQSFRDDPVAYKQFRKTIEQQMNGNFSASVKGSAAQKAARNWAEKAMRGVIASKDLQDKLVPDRELGCRRITPGLPYLKAIQEQNVKIVRSPIKYISEKGIHTSDDNLHRLDVLVCATDFDTSFRPCYPIIGRNQVNLRDLWREQTPEAYMGLTVSSFPNYFNAKHTSIWSLLFENEKHGGSVAFSDSSTVGRIPVSTVKQYATTLSTALYGTHDVRAGDIVCIFSENSIWYPVAVFAVLRLGAIVSPASPASPGCTSQEAAHILNTVRSKVTTVTNTSFQAVNTCLQLPKTPCMALLALTVNEGTKLNLPSVQGLSTMLAPQRPVDPWVIGPVQSSHALLCFTSGTTSLPKATMISHQSISAQLYQVRAYTRSDHPKIVLGVLPLYHITGVVHLLHLPLLLNQEVVIMSRFSLSAMLQTVRTFNFEELWLVLLRPRDLKSVRQFNTGAAPLGRDTIRKLAAQYPHVAIRQAWGMTESCSCLTLTPNEQQTYENAHTVGKVVAGTILKVVRPGTDEEVDVGKSGEILARGPQVMMGYFDGIQATNAALGPDSFLRTGDIGYVDDRGWVHIEDRLKEIIKTVEAAASIKNNEQWMENVSTRAELATEYALFEKNLSFPQTLRIYWRSIAWVLYGLAVVFGYGIDGVVASNLISIPAFRERYGKPFDSSGTVSYIISATWIAVFNGGSQATAVLGAYIVGYLAERIGRKNTNLISCIISMGGIAAQYASNEYTEILQDIGTRIREAEPLRIDDAAGRRAMIAKRFTNMKPLLYDVQDVVLKESPAALPLGRLNASSTLPTRRRDDNGQCTGLTHPARLVRHNRENPDFLGRIPSGAGTPSPAPVEDCYASLKWLYREATTFNIDVSRIALMGESAGGGLAAAVALLARDRGEVSPPLAKQILIQPMLDDRNTTPGLLSTDRFTWTYEDNLTGWTALLGSTVGTEDVPCYAAPARAMDLRDLPPAYLEIGELDIFYPEAASFASRLRAASVQVEFRLYPCVPHAFYSILSGSKAAHQARDNQINALRSI